MQILLTGATGFVGQQLLKNLAKRSDLDLRISVRSHPIQCLAHQISVFTAKTLSGTTNWQEALVDCEVVIHTAARAHVMKDKVENPLEEFRNVNTVGTLHLAQQAAQAGVKRFIFISSIKVNGEATLINQNFRADDQPNPQDPYAISKYEAEQGLQHIAAEYGMEIVIIRPPLIYGPGVKGNFQSMLCWLQKGIPLPLGSITNKRSFVSIANLISLIQTCISHPHAANQVFLVSDGEDLSTTELLHRIALVLNKPARLIPVPQRLLSWFATGLGQKAVFERLAGSLQINMDKTRTMLDWKPEASVTEGLETMMRN